MYRLRTLDAYIAIDCTVNSYIAAGNFYGAGYRRFHINRTCSNQQISANACRVGNGDRAACRGQVAAYAATNSNVAAGNPSSPANAATGIHGATNNQSLLLNITGNR